MLDPIHAVERQKRLLQLVVSNGLDAVVCGAAHFVQYFTTFRPDWKHHAAFVLTRESASLAVVPDGTGGPVVAQELSEYAPSEFGTLHEDLATRVASRIAQVLRRHRCSRIGLDSSPVAAALACLAEDWRVANFLPDLLSLRRVKHPDELAMITTAASAAAEMLREARQCIGPGVEEVEVFTTLQRAAVRALGEPLAAPLGNDFRCAAGGGPARAGRKAADNELYIVDVGPCFRGYFADACRTFCVGGEASEAQHRAWKGVTDCLRQVESLARPGVTGRWLHEQAGRFLRKSTGLELPHHLGHGVGMSPHEYPRLHPGSDDTLAENQVIALEPGVYADDLRAGVRIENLYLVTASGLKCLVDAECGL
jgi:Xaa-Pro aminopeptidase